MDLGSSGNALKPERKKHSTACTERGWSLKLELLAVFLLGVQLGGLVLCRGHGAAAQEAGGELWTWWGHLAQDRSDSPRKRGMRLHFFILTPQEGSPVVLSHCRSSRNYEQHQFHGLV